MTLHNYIRRHAESDKHFDKHGNENATPNEETDIEAETQGDHSSRHDVSAQEMEVLRNNIAASLMNGV